MTPAERAAQTRARRTAYRVTRHPIVTDSGHWREILTAARDHQGMSQREVARRIGTAQSAVSDLETGVADLRIGTIIRWAAAVGYQLKITLTPAPET